MKQICVYIIVGLILLIFIFKNYQSPNLTKIDSCLDRGYCWDYIRHRCEEKDQGFCIKNSQECTERNGKWQSKEQYCLLPN